MSRYFKIYLAFLKNCLSREMEFRSHFIFYSTIGLIWSIITLLTFIFIFRHISSVQGWSLEQMLLLTATVYLFDRIFDTFFEINFQSFASLVTYGGLDLALTRPISAQFFVSLRRFSFASLFNLFAMILVISYLIRVYFWPTTLTKIITYLFLILPGLIIIYSLWFSTLVLVFWLGNIDNIHHLFRPVYQIARIPIDITGPILRPLFTYILPLAFVATVPVKTLFVTINWGIIIYGLIAAIVLLWLSHRLWLFALKHYSSASS